MQRHGLICCDLVGKFQVISVENAATTKAGRNAIVISMMVCCGFVVCWSYAQIAFFVASLGFYVDITSWFYHFINMTFLSVQYIFLLSMSVTSWFHHFGITLRFANSCINPFIYAAKYVEFQNGVRRMVDRIKGNPHQDQPEQNANFAVVTRPTLQQTSIL